MDIRKASPTFDQYIATELKAKNKNQLLVPRDFAHGFVVLGEEVIFAYKVDNYYNPGHDVRYAIDAFVLKIIIKQKTYFRW